MADVASAAIGTLIYQFDGDPILIGVRPTGSPGSKAPRALVNLKTFEGRLLGPSPTSKPGISRKALFSTWCEAGFPHRRSAMIS